MKTFLKTKIDVLIVISIMVLYGALTFYNLGDMKAPSTAYDTFYGKEITLVFEGTAPFSLAYYIAPKPNVLFDVEIKTQDSEWDSVGQIEMEDVFKWQYVSMPTSYYDLVKLRAKGLSSILELVFLDSNGNIILPSNYQDYPTLFDEQDLYPGHLEAGSYLNSMYFDEIYHARSAYEMINGLYTYENTHPPLGKILIATGIQIFDMNPFGWRFMGALSGLLMIPVIYCFAKKLTRSTFLASIAGLLLSFDFMHFTQTRVATIDTFVVLFILLSYYFMYEYVNSDLDVVHTGYSKKPLVTLFLSGLFMGLGIAVKWTGVYAAVGLAFVFFQRWFTKLKYTYVQWKAVGKEQAKCLITFKILKKLLIRTIIYCILSFLVLSAVIYTISYIPFVDGSESGLIERMLNNQYEMFSYHTTLLDPHPFSSKWYEWLVIKTPMCYYTKSMGNSVYGNINAMGNPVIWWGGLLALLYGVFQWVRHKDRDSGFIVAGYLAQLIPWVFVTRVIFIYHYFTCVPFLILMIVYTFHRVRKFMPKKLWVSLIVLFTVGSCVLFIMFYPVLSGYPVRFRYVSDYLKWFEGWTLIYK